MKLVVCLSDLLSVAVGLIVWHLATISSMKNPLNKVVLYVQVERRIEELLARGRYRVGDRIPPEVQLVESLGVSRTTVRAGVTRLVKRGMLERRQGSGTFLVRLPEGSKLRKGLERLESYTVQADRLGLELDSRDLRIEKVRADSQEASALEVSEGRCLLKISRILLVSGKPAAWTVDTLLEDVIPIEQVKEYFRPDTMLLDLLVAEGVPISFSELTIDAELIEPGELLGKKLNIISSCAALSLTETMYLTDGHPVQWSHNVFLPQNLDLRIVRELSEVRRLQSAPPDR